MKILLLAPHPFYQERGTPIAVNLLLEALGARGHLVDVLTYHEGGAVSHPGVTIHRIRHPPFIRNVSPGFSFKKVICDGHMFWKLIGLVRRGKYDVIHAVEESVFMAMFVKWRRGIPYLYDMDSSMPQQIVAKHPMLRLFRPFMNWCERRAIRGALAVVPMCDALADDARRAGAKQVFVLRDVSLVDNSTPRPLPGLKESLNIRGICFLYVGNLEPYQGIDLLLSAFDLAQRRGLEADLVLAGGTSKDIERYRAGAVKQFPGGRVHFIGHQQVARMAWLFDGADVLVSPRIAGINTPMKIYSYLHSGKAIIATDLTTHTQVLTPAVAVLVSPTPDALADAMLSLAADPARRKELGAAAHALAEQSYSRPAFHRAVADLYNSIVLVGETSCPRNCV